MGSKRKLESPLTSEPSPKIRRVRSANSELEETQDEPTIFSPLSSEQAKDEVEIEAQAQAQAPSFYRAPLTENNLRQLEEMTQSKNTNTIISGSSSGSDHTANSNANSKADGKSRFATTDSGFDQRFRENGGLGPLSKKSLKNPPADLDEIEAYLDQSRSSASPTSSQHERFIRGLERAANERDIEALYSGRVLKNTNQVPELEDIDYGANIDKQWVDFDKDVGFNNGLSAPKPDLTEGYLQRTFPPNIKSLGGAATLVRGDPGFVALPHFAAEFKGLGKDLQKGEVQAGYDGAAMVYARTKALQHIGQPDPERHASPLTLASDGRNWAIYAHYAHKDAETEKVENFQYEVKSGRVTRLADFKRTHKISRNAQDWGRQESSDLRDRLQQHYDLHGMVPTGSAAASAVSKSRAASTSSKQSAVNPAEMKKTSTPSQRTSNAGNKGGDNPKPSPVQKAIPSAPPSVASSGKGSVYSSGTTSTDSQVAPNATAVKSMSNNSGEISTPPSSRRAVPRSSPNDMSNASAKLGVKQKVQVESKSMPPPPSKVNRTPSKRDEGPKSLNGNKDTAPRRPSIDSSRSSRSSEARPDTLTPTRAAVASDAVQQAASNRKKEDRRRYRDREYGIQQLQYRRSDSPDKHREPRPQDQNREPRLRDMVRDVCSSAGGKDYRSERSSASGSSSSSTNSNHKLPSKPSFLQPVKTLPEPVKRPEYGESEQIHPPTSNALYGRRW